MLINQGGVRSVSAVNDRQILFDVKMQTAVSVIASNAGLSADSDGKKILKAGTPIAGDLTKRDGSTFALAVTGAGGSNAVGVLLHDVDVTAGNQNATCLIFGFVNLNRLESATQALITADVKAALPMIKFLKG